MERHETQGDRDNELEIVQEFAAAFGLTYDKLWHEGRYKMDFALLKGSALKGLVEVKQRNNAFSTIILDLSKAREMWDYHLKGIPTMFVVRIDGEIKYYKFVDETWLLFKKVRWHLSNVRETDNGPVIDIPWRAFVGIPKNSGKHA